MMTDTVDDAQRVQQYLPKPATRTPLEVLLLRRIDFLQRALHAMGHTPSARVPNSYDGSSVEDCSTCNALKHAALAALDGESWEDELGRGGT